MERVELINKINAKATDAGIKKETLERENVRSFLPSEGKFNDWTVVNEGKPNAYLALKSTNGGLVSISNILGMGFEGSKDDAQFREVTNPTSVIKGGFVLTGTKPVNPGITGTQASVIADLLDKKFTAESKEWIVLPPKNVKGKIVPYKEAECKGALTTRTLWKITVE